jgi:7-carboxy-7-deazaguanine synthase
MKWRIAEIFGPTIQGEGELIGMPCIFIRFGGCDFRCPPCDSPHAVLPHLVSQLQQLSVTEILMKVYSLDPDCKWVVFSGGNPALLLLEDLVKALHVRGTNVMIETQGSVYHSWIAECESVCVSPKGPSMYGDGIVGDVQPHRQVNNFYEQYKEDQAAHSRIYFKVVCFSEDDVTFAKEIHRRFPQVPIFLSVGNHAPGPTVGNGGRGEADAADIPRLLDRLKWLCERTSNDPQMKDVRVLPQMHVLAWGNERGR